MNFLHPKQHTSVFRDLFTCPKAPDTFVRKKLEAPALPPWNIPGTLPDQTRAEVTTERRINLQEKPLRSSTSTDGYNKAKYTRL